MNNNGCLVVTLTVIALDKKVEDIVWLHEEGDVGHCIDGVHGWTERGEIEVAWIGPDTLDPVQCFWRLVKAGKFARKAYVLFTEIDGTLPCWADLSDYEGGKFGSIYLLAFDADTIVGVKPSQKGVMVNMK